MTLNSTGWQRANLGGIIGASLLICSWAEHGLAADLGTVPDEPAEIVSWVAKHWREAGWGASEFANYMRALDDIGWQARMLGTQKLVSMGPEASPALTQALNGENKELQIFAAQTFGYLPTVAPTADLIEVLKHSPSNAARLYAADTLGMQGGESFKALFEAERLVQKNRDVKKHLGYALERSGTPVRQEVIEALKNWDPSTINSAEVGKQAPDFELESLNGGKIKLSQFRGKSPVVLVFIYGDT